MTLPPLPPPPPWLAPLQGAFAALLQAPLDTSMGRFQSLPSQHDPQLLAQIAGEDAHARLSLYHEQYWARLMGAMQSELPRATAVLGAWRFNRAAMAHLQAHPPAHSDLARCADGFAAALAAEARAGRVAEGVDPTLLQQAVSLDEARRAAFLAPYAGVWQPSGAERAALAARPLRWAEGVSVVREDWALAGISLGDPSPPPLPTPQLWVVYRSPRGVAMEAVAPAFAQLLTLAHTRPLPDAIAQLTATYAARQGEALAEALPGWAAHALARGWWVGLR